MRKSILIGALGVALSLAASFCPTNAVRTMAQGNYVNGILVTDEDYDDPGYWKYVNAIEEDKEYGDKGNTNTANTNLLTTVRDYYTHTTSILTGYTYNHNSKFEGKQILDGIDVSKWQGDIDWKKVKDAGIDFAIIRAGYRTSSSTGSLYTDPYYEQNMKGAIEAQIRNVGVYMFSQAITEKEAIEEAEYVLNLVKGYDFNMPIVMDVEYVSTNGSYGRVNPSISKEQLTKVCEAFCDRIIEAGYTPMIYANKSFLGSQIDGAYLDDKYGIWLANYTTQTSYDGEYNIWQYSSSGQVDGISGRIDCNFWYADGDFIPDFPTGITLTKDKLTLTEGKSKNIAPVFQPFGTNDDVTWTSSNPTVAYINVEGKITAISKGKTTITATTTKGLSATCEVTVNGNLENYEMNELPDEEYIAGTIEPEIKVKSKEEIPVSGKVITEEIAMRMGPSGGYDRVRNLVAGDEFEIVGQTVLNNALWYAVIYTDAKDNTYKGFIPSGVENNSYVEVKKEYKTLEKDFDYEVEYKDNIKIGVATVNVKGLKKGTYAGTLTDTFKINPCIIKGAKTQSRNKTSLTIKWNKTAYASGYEIYRSDTYDGEYKLVKRVSSKVFQYTDTNVVADRAYYYKVRAYKSINKQKFYGIQSEIISTYTKKEYTRNAKAKVACNMYQYAGSNYEKLVLVDKGTKINILCKTTDKKGRNWYRVSATVKGKKYSGFMLASKLQVTWKGKVTGSTLNVRKGRGTNYAKLGTLKKGAKITIYSEKNGWYEIRVKVKGVTKKGYVSKDFVKV